MMSYSVCVLVSLLGQACVCVCVCEGVCTVWQWRQQSVETNHLEGFTLYHRVIMV